MTAAAKSTETDEAAAQAAAEEAQADGVTPVASVPNADLEHTDGGATTRDGMDAGVPMAPGSPDEAVGPEDAFGDEPTRGDYSARAVRGPHMTTREVPEDERLARARELAGKDADDAAVNAAMGDVPRFELVPQVLAAQGVEQQ